MTQPDPAIATTLGRDIRVLARFALLAAAFVLRGVGPQSGSTRVLPRTIGWAMAAVLAFTGRTPRAGHCLRRGLAKAEVPVDERRPTAPPPVQAAKRLLRAGLGETFSDPLHHGCPRRLPLMRSTGLAVAMAEGLQAVSHRRRPNFQGR